MKLSTRSVLACAALGALAACAQAEQPPAPLGPPVVNDQTQPALTADQVKSLVVGNTATGPMSGSHINFKMYVAADGTALADLPMGVEHGIWHVTADGQWCMKWENYRAAQEYCQRVYPDGDKYKFVDRTSEEIFTFEPGRHITTVAG